MENTENTESSTVQSQKSKEVFLAMVGYLGLKSEVKDKVSGKNIILTVSTDEPGRLIGRNGSALDNVGLLMNRILKKEDVEFPKVIIDVDGYDKKSKRDKRKPRRQERPRRSEKTVVMDDAVEGEDAINRYVDEDSNTITPVTTVPISERDDSARGGDRRGRRGDRRGRRGDRQQGGRGDRQQGGRGDRQQTERGDRQQTERGDRQQTERGDRQQTERGDRQQGARHDAPLKKIATNDKAVEKVSGDSVAQVSEKTAAQKPAKAAEPKTAPQKSERPAAKSTDRTQMQCRNAAKEVKRWGESTMLPPQSEVDCTKVLDYFKNDKDLSAAIDESRSYGDKKRVRISLNKS